jgi:hypothetical protein
MRCFFVCFNVNPEFAREFKFAKSKGGGEFTIQYMNAGFNQEAEFGEFYIEFAEYIWEHKLVEALETAGASQVFVTTFPSKDWNESAANALCRVLTVMNKTGISYTQGKCSETVLTKAQAKFAESQKKQYETSEFDEKTAAAIKQSLADIGETNKQSLAEIGAVNGKVDNIQEGVCHIIPELKTELERVKKVNQDLVLSRDQQEAKTARATHRINVEIERADALGVENVELKAEHDELKAKLRRQALEIEHLREVVNLSEAIKHAHSLEFHLKRVGERLNEDENTRKYARCDS